MHVREVVWWQLVAAGCLLAVGCSGTVGRAAPTAYGRSDAPVASPAEPADPDEVEAAAQEAPPKPITTLPSWARARRNAPAEPEGAEDEDSAPEPDGEEGSEGEPEGTDAPGEATGPSEGL